MEDATNRAQERVAAYSVPTETKWIFYALECQICTNSSWNVHNLGI